MNLETLNWVDIILGATVLISALIGIARGLIKEVLSLLAWAVSFWIAWKFADMVDTQYIRRLIDEPTISYLAAFGGLFLVSIFALGLFNMLIGSFLAASGLGGIDRLLGMVFGFLRGILIAGGMVFIGKFIPPVHENAMWKSSKLQPTFDALAEWGIAKLPQDVRNMLNEPLQKIAPAPQMPAEQSTESASTVGQQPTRPHNTEQAQASQRQQAQNIAEIGSHNQAASQDSQNANQGSAPTIVLESTQGQ